MGLLLASRFRECSNMKRTVVDIRKEEIPKICFHKVFLNLAISCMERKTMKKTIGKLVTGLECSNSGVFFLPFQYWDDGQMQKGKNLHSFQH